MSAALKAVSFNRIGDAALLVFIAVCISAFGSLDFSLLVFFMVFQGFGRENCFLFSYLIFIAAIVKSAQFGFHG